MKRPKPFSKRKDIKIGFFIIDDSTNPKRGKKMESAGYNHSSIEGKQILSRSVVTSYLQYQDLDYPLLGDVYKKREDGTKKEEFKTKIQMATKADSQGGVIPKG